MSQQSCHDLSQPLLPTEYINLPDNTKSDHAPYYRSWFRDVEEEAKKLLSLSEKEQVRHKIRFSDNFTTRPQAVTRDIYRGGTVVVYDVLMGPFIVEVHMLVMPKQAPSTQEIKSGSFGSIHPFQGENGPYVSKRIYFPLESFESILRGPDEQRIMTPPSDRVKQAVIECCFAKIGSMLRIGPQFYTHMGFDLVFFKDCIEFYMEQCHPHECSPLNISLEIDRFLKTNIRAMHMMRLVHKDIKPDNIVYSPSKKQFVICDFGISAFLLEQVGYKSLVLQEGTLKFMSPEYRQLVKGKQDWIDMYYNDLYALKQTLSELRKLKHLQISPNVSAAAHPVEEVARKAHQLWRQNSIEWQSLRKNEYARSLESYFPEFYGGSQQNIPANIEFMVSCVDLTLELPFFIHKCNTKLPTVKKLLKSCQRLSLTRDDIKCIIEAEGNHLYEQSTRRMMVLQKSYSAICKKQNSDQTIEVNTAELLFLMINTFIEKPNLHNSCELMIDKLQKLYEKTKNQQCQKIWKNSSLMISIVSGKAQVVEQFENMQRIEPEQLIIRACSMAIYNSKIGYDLELIKSFLGLVTRRRLQANLLIARCFYLQGCTRQAAEILKKSLLESSQSPKSVWRAKTTNRLIKYLREFDQNEALQWYDKQIKVTPIKYQYCLDIALAELYFSIGRQTDAFQIYERVLKTITIHRGQTYYSYKSFEEFAWKLFCAKKYKKCKVLSEQIYAIWPSSSIASTLGKCYLAMGEFEKSHAKFEEAIKLEQPNTVPPSLIVLESRADKILVLILQAETLKIDDPKRSSQLRSAFQKAISQASQIKISSHFNHFDIKLLSLAILSLKMLRDKSNLSVYLTHLKKSLIKFSKVKKQYYDYTIECMLATISYGQPALQESMEIVELVQVINRQHETKTRYLSKQLRQKLAQYYLKLNLKLKACEVISPFFLKQNEQSVRSFSFFSSAQYFYSQKLYSECIALLRLGSTRNSIKALFLLSMCLLETKNINECKTTLIQCVNFAAQDEQTLFVKGQSHSLLGDLKWATKRRSEAESYYDKAIDIFYKLAEANAQNFEFYVACGVNLIKAGRHQKALPWFQATAILSEAKLKNSYLMDLAFGYAHCGQFRKAFDCYRDLLQQGVVLSKQAEVLFYVCCLKVPNTRRLYEFLQESEITDQLWKSLVGVFSSTKAVKHLVVCKAAEVKTAAKHQEQALKIQSGNIKTHSLEAWNQEDKNKAVIKEITTVKKMLYCFKRIRSIKNQRLIQQLNGRLRIARHTAFQA